MARRDSSIFSTKLAGWAVLAPFFLVRSAEHSDIFATDYTSTRYTAMAQIGAVPGARPLIALLPAPLAEMVRAGTNQQDLTPYLNRIISDGGTFDLGGFTYRIAGRLLPGPATHLTGAGTFLADPAFDDHVRGDNLQMMIRIADGLRVDSGVVFDGGSITRPGFWLTGARNTGPVHDVVLNGTFRNLSFDGIDISRNNGAWRNAAVTTSARIENVGWIGANLEGVSGLVHDRLSVFRSGFHGIYVGHGTAVRGDSFNVDKSRPPYRVYDGPGSFGGHEKGFLFGHFSTIGARWTHFRLYDNRNAGYDGFGIGEDGPLADPESRDIHAQGEVWYAGLFGFDVSSDMVADIAIHHSTRQGVQFGLDLGGVLKNVRVKALVEGNREDEGARFSATGIAVRRIATHAGSPFVTIIGSGDFTVVPGQSASADGIAPDAKVLSITGDRVKLDRPAVRTHMAASAIFATFRGNIAFEDCLLDLKVLDTDYGLGVQSDADGFTRYRNVRVIGDLSRAARAGIRNLNGRRPKGITISARINSGPSAN